MPRNNPNIRPENNYGVRTTVTQGGPNPVQFIDVPKNNGTFGNSAIPSSVSLAENIYAQPAMKWNKGGNRQVFATPKIADLNNKVVEKVPFTPIRTFYAVPTPRIGLTAVTSLTKGSTP